MKNLFKPQLDGNPSVIEEIYDNLNSKEYDCGGPILIGDQVLFAMLIDPVVVNQRMTIKLITLNERYFDLYEPYYEVGEMEIPTIKLKEKS
jgi:hypothetical protein